MVSPTRLAEERLPPAMGQGLESLPWLHFWRCNSLTSSLHPRIWWMNEMKKERFGFYKVWLGPFSFFFFLPVFDLARDSASSPMLQTQRCLPLRGSSSLAEVSDFQGSRMRELKQKVKVYKQKMQQSSLLELSHLSIMQKINSRQKWLMQVCQRVDQKHAEFSSMFCTEFDGVLHQAHCKVGNNIFWKKNVV